MPRPLESVQVLDASSFISGPLAATMLADLGADVLKIEAESGHGLAGWGRLVGVAPEERVTIVYTFIAEVKANPDCVVRGGDVPGAGRVPLRVLRLGVPPAVGP